MPGTKEPAAWECTRLKNEPWARQLRVTMGSEQTSTAEERPAPLASMIWKRRSGFTLSLT